MFAPDKTTVPAPELVRPPLPPITPVKFEPDPLEKRTTPPDVFSAPVALLVILPPFRVNTEPLAPVKLMAALILKLLLAISVKFPLPVEAILDETVRFPSEVLPLAVVTVTFAPEFSAEAIDALLTVSVALVPDQVLLVLLAVLAAELIVISVGSINQRPAIVAPPALTCPCILRVRPEVSR